MDERLYTCAQRIEKQIKDLSIKEEVLMNLEASEKTYYSNLYLKTKGTVAEREAHVETNPEWENFKKSLAMAKVECNRERRMLELLFKASDWEYGSMKQEAAAIKRQV